MDCGGQDAPGEEKTRCHTGLDPGKDRRQTGRKEDLSNTGLVPGKDSGDSQEAMPLSRGTPKIAPLTAAFEESYKKASGKVGVTPAQDYNHLPQSLHVISGLSKDSSPVCSPICGNESTDLSTGVGAFEKKPTLDKQPDREKSLAPASLEGLNLVQCGPVLLQRLLEVVLLRSQTSGKRDKYSIFPLPTSRSMLSEEFDLKDDETSWLIGVCIGLNSFWGGDLFYEGPWNEGVKCCLRGLVSEVKRFCAIQVKVPEMSWADLFKVRSVDYRGEEVKVARRFAWKNIAPALPAEVGKVPLEEVCTLGCRHYVRHFEQYLRPQHEWEHIKGPSVMVDEDDWPQICSGLVEAGVCTFIEESEVFEVAGKPVLNGLFGVTKDDFTDSGVEIYRLIMNLIPLNALCKPMAGDVDTLPTWSGMNPMFLQPSERLLVSSEDVKCFFYTMSVPPCWYKFLAFNKLVPERALPLELRGRRVYLTSKVLPMGFLNSVSLAQHVHRNLVLWSAEQAEPGVNAPDAELRKDRPFSQANPLWRVYLDNYDILEKVQATEVVDLAGSHPEGVLALRNQYEVWGVPRNIKKSVSRALVTELQGATVDGSAGVAYPRENKLAKYFGLALLLCQSERAKQKQWQVVCGGLVYFTMFRRPLLGTLNRVWTHIESYASRGLTVLETPDECKLEVLRFLALLPLARMDFRLSMHPMVTCSDASTTGGGVCASVGLTPYGAMVSQGHLRGETAENRTELTVLSIGLFDGISALRVGCP